MNFNCIERRLNRWYSQVTENGVTYYLNKDGQTVATKANKLIVMYFFDNKFIWNHNDVVAVAVAKDFVLTKECRKTIADVVVVNGLCGSTNTIIRKSNQLLSVDSSEQLAFNDDYAVDIVGPYEIINKGILDSKQFSTCELEGALIDVQVRDATGSIKTVPYIVGKGVVSAPRIIGTLGKVLDNGVFKFDKGLELIIPKCLHYYEFDNLVYGILSVKAGRNSKKHPKFIQKKDYKVYSCLRKKHNWHYTYGFNTAGSAETRSKIEYTQYGTNYHNCTKVHFK